jgi:hypothetical protein
MQEAGPDLWAKMSRLYTACGEQPVDLCEAAMAERTIPPGQTLPAAKGTRPGHSATPP